MQTVVTVAMGATAALADLAAGMAEGRAGWEEKVGRVARVAGAVGTSRRTRRMRRGRSETHRLVGTTRRMAVGRPCRMSTGCTMSFGSG